MKRLVKGILIVAVAMLTACTNEVAYHHYESVAEEGWDKEDTLLFKTDTLYHTASYSIEVNLRTTSDYPYKQVMLMVEERVLPNKAKRIFPVTLQIASDEGEREGEKLQYYELEKQLALQQLSQGDSLQFRVYHKMRRLSLPGIKDVGIKIRKSTK
ncbi:MAG: gliding motility lipoprotein GldH [Prevotella sp.]|nr:gliding motility lipoprotein GldH [Prevotella sp.]